MSELEHSPAEQNISWVYEQLKDMAIVRRVGERACDRILVQEIDNIANKLINDWEVYGEWREFE